MREINIRDRLGKTQLAFVNSDVKFSCFSGGYKSGKTHAHARKGIKCMSETYKSTHNKRDRKGLIAEPTYRMNQDLLIPAYEEYMFKLGLPFKWYSSDSYYETPIGVILLRTLDKRASLEGHNLTWFGLDEIDLLPYDKANESWRVLTSKLTKGAKQYGFCTGTNEGYEFIYTKFVKGATRELNKYYKDNSELFCVSTFENADNLPPDYFDTMKGQLDERTWQRYIDGEFVNITSGRVYYNYTPDNHCDMTYKPDRDTFLCWDFNVNPLSCIIVQEKDKKYYAVKEFVYPSNTETTCLHIDEFFNKEGKPKNLKIRGDYTGKRHTSNSSQSDWQIIEETFKNYKDYESYVKGVIHCRRQKDRTTATNRMFKNAYGEITLFVNPETCPKLNHDLNIVCWKEGGQQIDKKLEISDPSDALSYFPYKDFPVLQRSEGIYVQ